MSYIRAGQRGYYVDIPCGSVAYIYDNGTDISGESYAEFAAHIGSLVYELDVDADTAQRVQSAFAGHFGGWDDTYSGTLPRPERAEIFCQCIDSRIDTIELTDEIHEAVQNWVAADIYTTECYICEDEFRDAFGPETTFCSECYNQHRANEHGITVAEVEQSDRLFDHILEYADGDINSRIEEASEAADAYIEWCKE